MDPVSGASLGWTVVSAPPADRDLYLPEPESLLHMRIGNPSPKANEGCTSIQRSMTPRRANLRPVETSP